MTDYYSAGPLVFNRIFVSGSLGCPEEEWRNMFTRFGTIQDIYVMKTKQGQEQGSVFISYSKTSEACKAVETMHGKKCYNSPRILKVEIAKARQKKDVVEINYDHVGEENFLERIQFHCDKTLTKADLKDYFGQWGTIVVLYLVMERGTSNSRGIGWLKYSKGSEAALALEEADPEFKVDWYDVRPNGTHSRRGETGWALRGSGGNKVKFDEHGNLDYHSLTGITEEDLDFMPGFEPIDPASGPDLLEAITPPGMTKEMVKGLFDLVPGMEESKLDTRTGIAKIKYASPSCAAYAKDKLNGFSYAGMPMEVKFGKKEQVAYLKDTAAELKSTMDTMLQNGTSDTAKLASIMESLKMVTDALQKQGVSVTDKPPKDIPWCNAALPPRKPLLPQKTPVVGRLFFVATPEPFFDKILYNVFCRFGDLIRVGFEKDKKYGFAHFGSQEAADAAKKAIHGHYIFCSKMKVEYASTPRNQDETFHSKRNRLE